MNPLIDVISKKYPDQLEQQIYKSKQLQRDLNRTTNQQVKPGPERKVVRGQFVFFTAQSKTEVDKLLEAYLKILGPRMPGNKRYGRKSFYAELVICLRKLHRQEITLPTSKNLSAKALQFGLGDLLREHRYTKLSDLALSKSTPHRRKIAATMGRIFDRASPIIKNIPPA